MDRAFPLAIGIAAGDAAARLLGGFLGVVLRIDFTEFVRAYRKAELVRILAREFQKLQVLVGHELMPVR